MRPRIGITTGYKNGDQIVDHHYIDAITAAGGLPMIVPMMQDEEAAAEFAAMLDGLVITGGPGITRGLVGALPDDLPPVDVIRDQSDQRIYEAAADKPILGICYGMQFVNAMHGGTIYGDLGDHVDHALQHSASRGGEPHAVALQTGTHLQQILNRDTVTVNTYHKQAVAEVGAGLTVAAIAPDGVVEAVESSDGRIIGVQFHPERMGDDMTPLFAAFIQQCRKTTTL